MQGCGARQIAALALYHAHCTIARPKPIEVSFYSQYIMPRTAYVPAAQVESPTIPYFVVAAAACASGRGQAVIEAPRVCQLCGRGFVDLPALFDYCTEAHHIFRSRNAGRLAPRTRTQADASSSFRFSSESLNPGSWYIWPRSCDDEAARGVCCLCSCLLDRGDVPLLPVEAVPGCRKT